jgi:hypothetical protein
MPAPKRSIQSAVTIDGFPLIWHLHREQQWSTEDNMKGLAIHVRVAQGARRELLLEYPVVRRQMNGWSMPALNARPTIVAAQVRIRVAQLTRKV